jgi:hypothetical protein
MAKKGRQGEGGGQPMIVLTDEQKAQVEALAAYLTKDQIADYFGIGRTTYYAIEQRDPEVLERYNKGKAKAIGAVAQGLVQKARDGDNTCMMFYLKTQARWSERTEVDHTSSDGSMTPVTKIERVIVDKE